MTELPRALYKTKQLRELERLALEEAGIAGSVLMSRAGMAVYRALRQRWPRARRILLLCGTGNNGGDGFVVARLCREAGLEVQVMLLGEPGRIQGDARVAYDAMLECGLTVTDPGAGYRFSPDLVVDAVLGTGLERELSGSLRQAVEMINQGDAPIVAVDIPTGLHADSGKVMGVAVRACLSVSFIGLKQGMLTGDGPAYCGDILFDDLDLPAQLYARVPADVVRITAEQVRPCLSPRPRTAHKGQHGHVLVIGGECGMAGAVRMAGEAAARAGAGLVSIATRTTHAAAISMARPELMSYGIGAPHELTPLLQRASVIAIGPGLGRSAWALSLLGKVLDSHLPLVVDADTLNLLAEDPCSRDHWILTPHPGEAARLLRCTGAEVQADRFHAVTEIQRRYGGVCVLKGAGTLVKGASPTVAVCDAGNPGMASGGMGDVLTGIIAALWAQGASMADAACVGVYVHARAGDAAAKEGERGLLASDLLPHVRRLVNRETDSWT